MDKRNSALVLFSGGLDSILAAKSLIKQGIRVTALSFSSNFFDCEKARMSAKDIGVALVEKDISREMIELVKHPPNGYGKRMNPCIDCHGLMFRQAAQYSRRTADKDGNPFFDIIASGEVLGQRPFSQTAQAMKRVEKLAGTEILRPLCAKLLPETSYEKKGLVDRSLLHAISGRSRHMQAGLARDYGIAAYPSPAGGCLLTDSSFAGRLSGLLSRWPGADEGDIELLKAGRVYWMPAMIDGSSRDNVLVVVARNEQESTRLGMLAQKGDFMLQLKELKGPLTLVRGLKDIGFGLFELSVKVPSAIEAMIFQQSGKPDAIISHAALLTGLHSACARGREVRIMITRTQK